MFDVCAVMRQQYERKLEAALARPAKLSHHFSEDSVDDFDYDFDDGFAEQV